MPITSISSYSSLSSSITSTLSRFLLFISPTLQLFYFISNFRILLLFIVKHVDHGISCSKTETECWKCNSLGYSPRITSPSSCHSLLHHPLPIIHLHTLSAHLHRSSLSPRSLPYPNTSYKSMQIPTISSRRDVE